VQSRDAGETGIRAAVRADAPAIAEIWTEVYTRDPSGGRTEPYTEAEAIDCLDRGEVLVAERVAVIVGVVVLYGPRAPRRAVAQEGEAELARLGVTAVARRAGIGRRLVEACEERARGAGWNRIALWSRPAQVTAHSLYESRGFVRAPERDGEDPGGRRLVFLLDLG
jgi:ribosomal protein S18 acetylase RimI-like enzyme